jgi:subtilisin family serine protease
LLTVKGGKNFSGDGKGDDKYGDIGGEHGTQVAGVVAANGHDGGLLGVAPRADLYSLRVFDAKGGTGISHIIDAINWCEK